MRERLTLHPLIAKGFLADIKILSFKAEKSLWEGLGRGEEWEFGGEGRKKISAVTFFLVGGVSIPSVQVGF